MSTYRTYFRLFNSTNMPIKKVTAQANDPTDFGSLAHSPDAISRTELLNPGQWYDTVLELKVAQKGGFTVGVEFDNSAWLEFHTKQHDAYYNKKPAPVEITYHSRDIGSLYDLSIKQTCRKRDPEHDDEAGINIIMIYQDKIQINSVDWMKHIFDDKWLCDINLPGTHDSDAVNTWGATPYACQDKDVAQQLLGGIRALDIRLKVKTTGTQQFNFWTCHGDFDRWFIPESANEYREFTKLLDDCKSFLDAYPSETIVMSLKIDDWNGQKPQHEADVYDSLRRVLANYPCLRALNSNNQPVLTLLDGTKSAMPTLGQARGKIYVFNRMETSDKTLGTSLNIQDNRRTGRYISSGNRNFDIYVQDRYDFGKGDNFQSDKLALVTAAFDEKARVINSNLTSASPEKVVVWNFASAVYQSSLNPLGSLEGVLINKALLSYFGQVPGFSRPRWLGWCFFDFALNEYEGLSCVDLFISSNFDYEDHPSSFVLE